jgi:hypothetical protein
MGKKMRFSIEEQNEYFHQLAEKWTKEDDKKVTADTKKIKISIAFTGRKGIVFSEDHKANIANALKGIKRTREQKAKISTSLKSNNNAIKKPLFVNGIPYESLKAAGKALNIDPDVVRSRVLSKSYKFKDWKYFGVESKEIIIKQRYNAVAVSIDGVIYPTIKEAARVYGVSSIVVRYRLNSKSERFKDWKYLTKE